MSLVRHVYEHSPVFWQNLMCTAAGYQKVRRRYNRHFEERRKFFREAARWPLAQSDA